MTASAQSTLPTDQQAEVRGQVRSLLQRSRAFDAMAPEERRTLAHDLVQVVSFLVDPGAGKAELRHVAERVEGPGRPSPAVATALAQDDDKRQGTGAQFTGGAAESGTTQFTRLVDEVDFTEFVSGLIEGVFTSIVDSSIRQMEAYQKLLEAVVASVKDFADENVDKESARDYLVNRYPKALRKEGRGRKSRVVLRDDLGDDQLPDLKSDLGFEGDADFDDEAIEQQIVDSARLKMARLKQQQLATMVLLGINRIVVTDGKINAKVQFEFKSEDTALDTASTAYAREYSSDYTGESSGGNIWGTRKSSSKLQTKVRSSYTADTKQESESKLEMKAKLTGEVTVNFRSETFPLDRLNPAELGAVQDQAAR